jgi:hypothetical protein
LLCATNWWELLKCILFNPHAGQKYK